jgi:hypothetical protein
MKKYKINKKTGCKYVDLTGLKFNKLTVITEDWKTKNISKSNGGIMWKCICDCGNFKSVLSKYLVQETTKSCGCAKKDANWKGYKEIPHSIFTKIKNWCAESRNIYFDLTIEQMWEIFKNQDKKCFYTGKLLKFGRSKNDNTTTASLDRIDSSKGYTFNNVVWCHKDINKMKMDFSVKYFKKLCKEVTLYSKPRRKGNTELE